MARGYHCAAHAHRSLVPIERHHIHPLGYHGPDTPDNVIPLCANAHGDVHYLLDALLKQHPTDNRTYGHNVRTIAHMGYTAVMDYATHTANTTTPTTVF